MTEGLIYSTEDLLRMLDAFLQDRQGGWWDAFFSDRAKPCPFFVEWPDENLVEWSEAGLLKPGRVLELGCGHGRNAVYLAQHGCQVDAVDFSDKAIAWAKERAEAAGVAINFVCRSIFDLDIRPAEYDLVYDAGCFHHQAPHRRQTYVELVARALKPDGRFGLVCFAPEGGSGLGDAEVYEQGSLGGGLGYTEAQLREVFSSRFNVQAFRRMREMPPETHFFGKDFLWTLLAEPLGNNHL